MKLSRVCIYLQYPKTKQSLSKHYGLNDFETQILSKKNNFDRLKYSKIKIRTISKHEIHTNGNFTELETFHIVVKETVCI